MCGIAGWVDWNIDLRARRDVLRAMTETLTPRGPDAYGEWIAPRAALGHTRLAVIDPEKGAQPMVRRKGSRTFAITYNGELYNTDELRRELESRGYLFETRCDTEVLLNACIEWGPSCLERLNGIYAFGVWSEPDGQLLLARDRLGVKPLFFAEVGDSFLFGSEIKALLANPLVSRQVTMAGFEEFFFMGPPRTPGSGIFRQIQEVLPGSYLLHDANRTEQRTYWRLESRPHEDDLDATVERVRELVVDAVTRQLVSDVPIATMVSGGLDSSSITAIAATVFRKAGRGPLDTWSLDFVDNTQHFRPSDMVPDEDHPWIEKVTRHLETQHHRVLLDTPELVSSLGAAMRARDMPGTVEVESSLSLFCREMKRGCTVALSGEAADEIFGGYRWFHQPESYTAGRFPWIRIFEDRKRMLSPDLRSRVQPEEAIRRHYDQAVAECSPLPGEDPLEAQRRQMFYFNLTRWLPMMLDRKDRASMAHGLEVRVPYCDHRIVEYLWNVPWTMKSCDGVEKGLLRRAMRGFLPEEVLWRKKCPYPTTHNPAYLRATKALLRERLARPASPLRPLLDMQEVERLMATPEERSTERHWFGLLWKDAQFMAFLCQFDMWMDEYRVSLA